jgi:DNA-binding transcriptional LysR family regulator
MNIQHLRYFLAVMDSGSISRAADISGVTQPTLSLALKRLEREFATPLFRAEGRGIRPLPAAIALAERIRPAVRALAQAKDDLNPTAPAALRIGVLQSLAGGWLHRLIGSFERPLRVTEGLAGDLERAVIDGSLDLALSIAPETKQLSAKVIAREPFMLFVGPGHPFAARQSVNLPELDGQPFVLRECCERLGTGRRLLKETEVKLAIVAKAHQEATAASLVAAGIGCTLAPRSWKRAPLHGLSVVNFELDRTIAICWKTPRQAATAASLAKRLSAAIPNS